MILKLTLFLILISSLDGHKEFPNISIITTDSKLQRLIIDKIYTNSFKKSDIYIGGTNIIYKISGNDFQIVSEYKTGPDLDNINCPPSPEPCDFERTLSDNVNKILLVQPNILPPPIIACGTLYQGKCLVLSSNLEKGRYIGDSNKTNFLASKKTDYAFTVSKNEKSLTVIAHQYDGRPLHLSPPAISIRRLVARPSLSFKYFENEFKKSSLLDLDKKFKTSYKIEYIYGFSHNEYSYILKRQLNLKTNHLETKLARFCNSDATLTSYIEITLECNFNSIPFDYGLAAYFSNMSYKLSQQFSPPLEDASALFISYASSTPLHTINQNYGSHVCCFPIYLIDKAFKEEIEDCSQPAVLSSLLTIFHGSPQKCTRAKKTYCSNPDNPYIDGKKTHNFGITLVKYSEGYITSLFSALINDELVLILGTLNGTLMKWASHEIIYSIQISQEKIEPVPAVDTENGLSYFVSGSKVIKYPYSSCAIYPNCDSCIARFDPLNCVWCPDYGCIQEKYSKVCNKSLSFHICEPKIIDFWPKNGSIGGGTNVTIYGNLASKDGDSNIEIDIKVAGVFCNIKKIKRSSVSCLTSSVPKPQFGFVEVYVKDTSFVLGYDIIGNSTSTEYFSYLEPELNSIVPNFAPFTNPVLISLKGNNLNIGFNRTVLLAEINCNIKFINRSLIICEPGKLMNASSPIVGDCFLQIDDEIFFIKSVNFSYLPDSLFLNIYPNTTTATSVDEIFIIGKHLTSIFDPKIKLTLTFGKKTITIISPCQALNTTIMICQAPQLPSNILPLTSVIVSYLTILNHDDQEISYQPEDLEFTLTFYPDPVFEIGREIWPINRQEGLLKIKGNWLSTSYNVSFLLLNLRDNSSLNCENLTKIDTHTLGCSVGTNLTYSHDDVLQVIAYVGKNKQMIGSIQFFDSSHYKKNSMLVFFVFTPFLILACLTVLILWLLRKKGYIFKRTRPTPDVFYHSSPFQRQGSENEYHSQSQDTSLPLLSRPKETHYVVDEQTKADLAADNILYSREYLQITDELIGKGEFGMVSKGYLRLPGKNEEIEVAVKTLRRRFNVVSQEAGEAFLREGLRMKDLTHENVLSLIGICFDVDGLPLVITPYMHNKDLYSYLREEEREFMLIELLNFGIQIAEGMNYLAQIKFVHRDLAARNCMVDKNLTVKIADFGLARDVYLESFYTDVDKPRKQLPIRWMAIESIEQGIYTIKTDVWSFGVLLWELVTRCSEPPFYGEDKILLSLLKFGRRLPQPDYCPDSIYRIMLDCWNNNPDKRPSFSELVVLIKSAIRKSQEIYLKLKKERTINYCNFPVSDYYNQAPTVHCPSSTLSFQSSIASSSKH